LPALTTLGERMVKLMKIKTEDKIIMAVIDFFGKYGYEGTSLSQIAKRVDIQKPSLYSHYHSKKQMVIFACQQVVERNLSRLRDIVSKNQNLPALQQLYFILLFFGVREPAHAKDMLFFDRTLYFTPHALKKDLTETLNLYDQSLEDLIVPIVQQGIQRNEIKPLNERDIFLSFLCLIDGVSVQAHVYGSIESRIRVDATWSFYVKGISQ
jgi:AcrR family transcriptional regulator